MTFMTKKVSHALITTGVILFLSLSGLNARQRLSAGAGRGVAAGIVASYGFARSLASLLYGVSTMDFSSFAVAAVLFFIVAMAACGIPAREAMRIEPIEALRYE
jgi:phage shock protein PspC (stress-responsive transcriptional regulator)